MIPMKNLLLILFSAFLATSSARAALILNTENPTIGTTNTTFNFQMFDSNLGTLTGVDLLFNSSIAVGSVSINTNTSGEDATFTNLSAFIRTSGTGLSQQNTTSVDLSLHPGLPSLVPADTIHSFSVTGSQSLIPSVLTYGINPANWGAYQNAGGVGNTPNFTGRALTSFSITSAVQPSTINTHFTAASSYTLRYTYTPTNPVPEPGQVATSLLVLGGVGTYFALRRRRSAQVSG